MNQVKTQFESLQFHKKLDSAVESWIEQPIENLQGVQKEDYERLIKALLFIQAKLKGIDPDLYSINSFNSLVNRLNNITSNATNFRDSKNYAYIEQANSQLDAILSEYKIFPFEESGNISENLTDTLQKFTQNITNYLQELADKRLALENKITAFETKLTGISESAKILEQSIKSEKQRIDGIVSEQQKQFSTAQEQRNTEFAASQKENINAFRDSQKLFSNEYQIILNKNQDDANKSLADVTEIQEKVNKIFNIVGNRSTSGNYKNTADKERISANWLRRGAIFLMILMALMAGWTFLHSLTHPEVDWKLFGFRLGTTIILALPALYLAQESAKHREREKINRKLELELASIDSYLALLPDAEKQKIKGGLTEKFFGKEEVAGKELPVTKHELFNLLADIVKNITKTR